jgi:hypothetical protein
MDLTTGMLLWTVDDVQEELRGVRTELQQLRAKYEEARATQAHYEKQIADDPSACWDEYMYIYVTL